MSRGKIIEHIFLQVFGQNLSSTEIIGDFLWLLADGLPKWVNTLRCGLFLLHPDSISATSILFLKKHFFFPSWWHRSAFLSVLSYTLRFEEPRVYLSFQMNIFGKRCCPELSYTFVIGGEFFLKFVIKSRVKDLLLAMFMGCTHLFSNRFLLSLHGQHGVHDMGLTGTLESSSSSNATGLL